MNMDSTIEFLANASVIRVEAWPGRPALDFIRGDLGLKGTKEGCREGDCGACAVLVGERLADGGFSYRATPSCLLALGELDGRHLVTIEGLASCNGGLTPVMKALLEENGSQCGFCSPGVVIALTAWLIAGERIDETGAVIAVEGNLCRCTGYGAIRRAAKRLVSDFSGLPAGPMQRLAALEKAGVVPPALAAWVMEEKGAANSDAGMAGGLSGADNGETMVSAGGTDWYVRNPDPVGGYHPFFIGREKAYASIEAAYPGAEARQRGLVIGAAVTVHEFFTSAFVNSIVPGIDSFESQVASSLIRNRATLGGNVCNASPVADLTAILMALDATVVLAGPEGERETPLARLFLGYKKLDLREGEFLARFLVPASRSRFNFEKVSKRRHLDIASANTACAIEVEGEAAAPRVVRAAISAGGMAAVPLRLWKTEAFLAGKIVDAKNVREAAGLAVSETRPMSDVRGSADYRRRLLERLVIAHFIRLFPEAGLAEELFP